jgi:hypothetical protein
MRVIGAADEACGRPANLTHLFPRVPSALVRGVCMEERGLEDCSSLLTRLTHHENKPEILPRKVFFCGGIRSFSARPGSWP